MTLFILRKYLQRMAVLVLLVFSLSGCVYLVIGGLGAVGGYVVSPDTVQGNADRDFVEVWDASLSVINIMGRVVKQNDKEGRIEAIVNNARVNVSLVPYSANTVQLTVKARRSFFPSISTAQDVYVKIFSQLKR